MLQIQSCKNSSFKQSVCTPTKPQWYHQYVQSYLNILLLTDRYVMNSKLLQKWQSIMLINHQSDDIAVTISYLHRWTWRLEWHWQEQRSAWKKPKWFTSACRRLQRLDCRLSESCRTLYPNSSSWTAGSIFFPRRRCRSEFARGPRPGLREQKTQPVSLARRHGAKQIRTPGI